MMNHRSQLISLAAALVVAAILSNADAFQSAASNNAFTSHDTKAFIGGTKRRIIPTHHQQGNSCSRHNTFSTRLYVSADIDIDTIKADEARAKAIAQKNAQLPKTNNVQPNYNKSERQPNSNDKEWKFFDTARLHVTAGSGGNGCVAFRRDRGEAMGGPNGGRGGSGGTVYFIADDALNTLAGLRGKIHVKADNGKNGIGKNKDGQHGKDIYVRVPCGTIVRELHTEKVAGELRTNGETLIVARGGRGGRGNAAFMTHRRTAPKFCEHGEPGAERWLSVELRLVADVGFLGMPNAGKSTLLSSASAAKPKIANYPFTTIVPNLGVCDLGEESSGLVLCDIPGLIEGAAQGTGLGFSFLRHVQRCKVLLHVVDGTSDDPVGDFNILNKELAMYDDKLAKKPQVVVLNKCDVSEVKERQEELVDKLRLAAGHSRVMTISAATTENVQELMARLKKFVEAEKKKAMEEDSFDDDVLVAEVDFSKAALDSDSDDFEIISDPAYPGQWRVKGDYIEQIAKMTHWEYPEAVERFGRQLKALGIADELSARGAFDGDLVMIDEYDFEFNPGLTNPYIPQELLEKDALYEEKENKEHMRAMLLSNDDNDDDEDEEVWRPFNKGGYMDMDKDEIVEFNDDGGWDLLEDDFDLSPELLDGDEFWTS
jgi:GTP-binding protein